MVAGVGMAHAAVPSDQSDSDEFVVGENQCDLDCCTENAESDSSSDQNTEDGDLSYMDDEMLPNMPEYNFDDDEYTDLNEEELVAMSLGLIEQFVARLFRYVLHRDHDTHGLQYWSNHLRAGRRTGVAVAHGFFFSTEFINRNHTNEVFINALYYALLGRSPDPVGRAFWLERLEAGLSRVDVFAGFVNSPEFERFSAQAGIVHGTFTPPPGGLITMFVTRMYRTTLQREPDATGLAHWTNALMDERITGAAIAYSFIFSNEMSNRNLTDAQFLEILYISLLGRESDPIGRAHWLRLLANSESRYNVFTGFVNSDEFDYICRTHGIIRGASPEPEYRMRGNTIVARIWNAIIEQQVRGISDRPEHIAGIIGNLQSEAGPNLCPFQQEIGGNRAGLGLMQWSHGRRTSLQNFMWANGISQADFTREMNRHLNTVCSGTCMHPPELLDAVIRVQINFMFHEFRNTSERVYLNFVDFPVNQTGVAGARAYAELFCAIALRPSPGRAGGLDDIQDVGVIEARRAAPFGGINHLDRISFSGLAVRRDRAEAIFRYFQANHR